MADVTIQGYDNEDIVRAFTVVTGTDLSPVAFDLTNYDIESDIQDQKTKSVVLRMTTSESDNRIVIEDAEQGLFTITITHGDIPYNPKVSLIYDMLLKSKLDGSFRRMFGGKVKILDGTTNPV